jgi:hypothetical protein
MPVYSDQIGGMINQQNQMFAGYGSFANSFSPGAPPGMMGYGGDQAPYGGAYPTFPSAQYEAGQHVLGGIHAALPAAIGAATFAGAFLPGAAGRMIGRLDPFQAALSGFGRASGVSRGIAGMGVMDSIGTMGANIGRIGAGGVGNVFRAGLAGAGGAAAGAFLPLAGMAAITHATGQMAQGAQFTGAVHRTLGENFRFLNPQSQTGHGFSREQGSEIADTVRTMGNRDIMSSPQELLRIMNQSIQGGMFRPVQDAKQFQDKFKEVVGALKEISKTFNTTLEGAMPFLQEGRRMGFWTPADVQRMASSTVGTAKLTGLSVAQVQQMQGQGAAMARQVGAQGTAGAEGMTRTMGIVGGAIRGGTLSEQQLSEMTGGLMGGEAIQAFSGQMQASATRFASSRTARWLLAATAGKDMKHLDAGKLALLSSGQMGLDGLRSSAEKNIQGRGADFVMGEEEMRGDLLKQGPDAQMGFLKGIVGKHLFGESGMDKLVTRRLIQRFMGGDSKQAYATAKILRDLPAIIRENQQRTEAEADQQQRDHAEMMDHSYEGLKRKVSLWWKSSVDEPLQKIGSQVSESIGSSWEHMTDKVWGRTPRGMRDRGVTSGMAAALHAGAMGDTGAVNALFATQGEMEKEFGRNSNDMGKRIANTALDDPSSFRSMFGSLGLGSGGGRISHGDMGRAESAYSAMDAASGFLNMGRAKAMGYEDVTGANTGLATVGKWTKDRETYNYALSLHEDNPMAQAKKLAEYINNSKTIPGEIKAQLAGKTPEQQAAILSAATEGGARSTLGLDMSGMAENIRKRVGIGEDLGSEKGIAAHMQAGLDKLDSALSPASVKTEQGGFWHRLAGAASGSSALVPGVAAQVGSGSGGGNRERLSKLMDGEDSETFQNALAKIASGDPKGKEVLHALAIKHAKDPEMTKMLSAMANNTNPEVAKAMTEIGADRRKLNTLHYGATVQRRLQQTQNSLRSRGSEEYAGVMKGLGDLGLGEIGELIENNKGLTGTDITDRLSNIAKKASSMSPEAIAQAQGLLKGVSGAGMFDAALSGALEQRGLKSVFASGTHHTLGQEANALSSMSGRLFGRSLTSQEIGKVHGAHGKEYIDELIAKETKSGALKAEDADTARDMLSGVRGDREKLYGAQQRLMKDSITGSLSNAIEKQRDLAGGLLGKLGSPSGIHQQLIDIGLTLKEIKNGGQLSGTGNPKGMGGGVGDDGVPNDLRK